VAAGRTLHRPWWWVVGLAGFLARGGIVLFSLPIVVLPSVVGLTTFIDPNSITAAGLAPRFVALLAAVVGLIAGAVLLGTLVAAATDRVLVRAVVGEGGDSAGSGPEDPTSGPPEAGRPGLGRLLVIRLVSLVPFGLGLAIGGLRLGQVGYQELILPSDSTTPFVIRVLRDAPEIVALLLLTWLASELLGAVAVRVALLDGRTAAGSLGGGIAWILRRPVRSLATLGATVIGSLILVGPAIVIVAIAWDRVRTVFMESIDPVAMFAVAVVLGAVWTLGLTLAGAAAAWRSATWSLALVEDHRGGGPVPVAGGTL